MRLTFDVEEALSQCKTLEDISGKNGLLKRMLKEMTEQVLEAELTEHLGYEKHSPKETTAETIATERRPRRFALILEKSR